jgi:predicted RNA-binding protein with PIN domain
MLLLVDGYNVTMRDAEMAGHSKERQREELLGRLRAYAHTLAPKGEIVVAFDAHAQLGRSSEEQPPVRAVFAPDADDEIVRRSALVRGQVTVVTDDMRLRARISQDVGRHVRFMDGASLSLDALQAARKRSTKVSVAREEGLPAGANRITEELKGIWLTEEELQ